MAVVEIGEHIAGTGSENSDDEDGPPAPPDDGGDDGPPQAFSPGSNPGPNTQQEGDPTYSTWAAFNEYAEKFGKEGQYADEAERETRMQNFQSNTGQADALNDMRRKNKDAVFG